MNRREWNQRLRSMIGQPTIEGARRHAHEIAEMIDVLPGVTFAEGTSPLWRQIGIDSFFGYARTLIEFLLIKPTRDAGDLTAHDVLGSGTAWAPSYASGAHRDALITVWDLSSKQQAHFTISRAAELPVGQLELEEIADDLLAIWDQFAEEANHSEAPTRANFSLFR